MGATTVVGPGRSRSHCREPGLNNGISLFALFALFGQSALNNANNANNEAA